MEEMISRLGGGQSHRGTKLKSCLPREENHLHSLHKWWNIKMESFTFFQVYRTWTSQPCLPLCCLTSPEQHLQPRHHPDLGHWEQVRCCADQQAAAAATWLYLHTSHSECQSQLESFSFPCCYFMHQLSSLKALFTAFSLIQNRNVPVQQKPAWEAKTPVLCRCQTCQPELFDRVT